MTVKKTVERRAPYVVESVGEAEGAPDGQVLR